MGISSRDLGTWSTIFLSINNKKYYGKALLLFNWIRNVFDALMELANGDQDYATLSLQRFAA